MSFDFSSNSHVCQRVDVDMPFEVGVVYFVYTFKLI